MKRRPTIPDLAKAAGVSVSTVNRVINEAEKVRQPTRERVYDAARSIGFYGLGSIEYSVLSGQQTHRIGVLLQQGNRTFYRNLGDALKRAAREYTGAKVELTVEYLDDLSPDHVAARLRDISSRTESVGIVAAQHPKVVETIDTILSGGVPVAALIAPLTASRNVGYVGLDHWKVGRTAAWAFSKMIHEPGKIGILIGNHRYRNQDLNESGFRSYFREHNPNFTLLEPLATYEAAAVGREMTETLLRQNPDLCGLFVSGGGITGALAALRDTRRREDFVAVGYELFDVTRSALIDGTLTMVISHPLERFAWEAIGAMIRGKTAGPDAGAQRVSLNFEIYTPENI